jgi:hypothetical protein
VAVGNILEEHKDGGSVLHLNVDSTAMFTKFLDYYKQNKYASSYCTYDA